MAKKMFCTYVVSILLLLPGCGGGGTGNAVPLPENTAIVLSSALAPGLTTTSVPIKAIEVTFTLPAAATPVLAADGTLLVSETGLKNLNSHGFIQTGSFNSATRVIRFVLLPNDIATTDLETGDIARLTYTTSGASLTSGDIVPVYKVAGPGSVDISNEIVPSVRIVKYQKP